MEGRNKWIDGIDNRRSIIPAYRITPLQGWINNAVFDPGLNPGLLIKTLQGSTF